MSEPEFIAKCAERGLVIEQLDWFNWGWTPGIRYRFMGGPPVACTFGDKLVDGSDGFHSGWMVTRHQTLHEGLVDKVIKGAEEHAAKRETA